ncbi:phage tail tape measure protein [Nocardia niigatensis]|uniref:phage tail tape measure protein n=1 Tax=Nocardia niigatensis TaxID=209249 RepID=UPI0002FD3515|nr:phage tail tape measure protein [Nocardia niigatensis]
MKGVWFDILPRMVGMSAEADKIVVESEKAGEKAGKAFSGMFSREATSATAKSVETMKAQVNSGISVLEQASARAVKAHDAAADAAGRVRIKEAALNDVRMKFSEDSVQYIRAEENLAKAKRDTATASGVAQTAALDETRAMEALAAKQDALAANQDALARSSGTMSTALKTAATVGVGGLIFGMGESIKAAGDFQASQTRLVTTAGEDQNELGKVSKGILDMAGQVGVSAEELSKGMYTIESAGFHGEAGLKLLKAASEGARQENADLKDVTDALTTSMHDFNIAPDQSAVVMSKMIAAVSNGKTTLGEFSGALHSVEPAAHAAGISLDDTYATLAMMTRTGESAQQSTENMTDAIRHLSSPTQQMTDEMAQFGISSADVQQHLGERGLTGTMDMLAKAIHDKMTPAQQIVIDTFNQNKLVVADAKRMFDGLPPAAQAVAQSVKDGTLSFAEFRKTGGGLAVDQKNMVDQWWALEKKADGFNSVLKSGKSDIQTYQDALSKVTGTVAGATVAMDITADNADDTKKTKAGIEGAKPEASGDIAGWSDVQGNFNQKLAQTKASVGSMAIAVGTDLLPVATKFLGVLQDTARWLDKHKVAADGVVATIGTLAGAWATIKVAQGTWSGLKTVIGGVKGVIGGVAKGAKAGANMLSSAANGARRLSLMAQGWWEWTGKARATAIKNFVATKVRAGVEAVQSAAAWVAQGARAAGAWVVMQAKAAGAFLATKASAAASAVETGGAWLAAQASAGAGWVGMQAKAAGAFLATKASAVLSAGETAMAWVVQNAKVVASFVLVEGASIAAGVAEKGMAAAQWLLNAAMDANPIGLVIVGLTALVGGVIYAWNHFDWFRNAVKDAWDWMKKAGDWIGHEFMDIWHKLGDFVHDNSEKIKNAGHAVGEAFQWGAKVAIDAWHDLEKGLGEPTYLVMRYIYQDGIRKMWDSASDTVGGALGHLPDLSNEIERIPHFASGGVYSGPGIVSQGSGWPNDDVNAKLSKDEGIAVPGFVKWFGVDNWHAANRYFSGRSGGDGFHFAPGGIFDGVGDFFSGASNPAEWLRTKLRSAVTGAEAMVGSDSMWKKLLLQLPEHMIGKLVDWGKDKLGSVVHGAKDLVSDVGHVLGFARGGIYADGPAESVSGLTPAPETVPDLSVDTGMPADSGISADTGLSAGPTASVDPVVTPDSVFSGDTGMSADPSLSATSGASSGLQVALDAIRDHLSTMYQWGGTDLSSGVDCSGLVGDAQLLATGQQPDHRVGTTDTMMSGGWPGMIKGATKDDYFVAGVNDHHMSGSILGTPFEARQTGEKLRMGSSAASPFDAQFVEQWHLDPTLIEPAYHPGLSDDPLTSASPTDKAAKYKQAAQKELDLAKKHDAEAEKFLTEAAKYKEGLPAEKQKHLDAVKRHLDAAAEADKLASFTTGAEQQKHLDAAKHDRELAQSAQDAAGNVGGKAQKYLDAAAKARQMAADERKRAKEDLEKADKAATSTGKKSKDDTNGGWMTFEQAGEKAGGLAATMFLDSTGLGNTIVADPNKSAVLRIGKQLTQVKTTGQQPNWGASPFLPSTKTDEDLSDLLPATHDLGGLIPPGLSLVNNKTGGNEVLVINPQLAQQRSPEPVGASRGRSDSGSGPLVSIGTWVAASDDQAEANRLGRTVGQYARGR